MGNELAYEVFLTPEEEADLARVRMDLKKAVRDIIEADFLPAEDRDPNQMELPL